jgi:hypothetical protein
MEDAVSTRPVSVAVAAGDGEALALLSLIVREAVRVDR